MDDVVSFSFNFFRRSSYLEPLEQTFTAFKESDFRPNNSTWGPEELTGFLFPVLSSDIENENPNVAINFYWVPLRRQIRIEGKAEKISISESEEYFHQRPRDSQIGALASPQSQPIPSRDYLDQIESEIKLKLGPDKVVPLPNWGGYLIVPHKFEFWQGQSNRLFQRYLIRGDRTRWTLKTRCLNSKCLKKRPASRPNFHKKKIESR